MYPIHGRLNTVFENQQKCRIWIFPLKMFLNVSSFVPQIGKVILAQKFKFGWNETFIVHFLNTVSWGPVFCTLAVPLFYDSSVFFLLWPLLSLEIQYLLWMESRCVFSVRLRYQVLDESTLPKKPAELTITIADASGARIHTWNLGYLQRKTNENKGKIGP